MANLLMMKGLPCSGKTKWATDWVNASQKRVRVSWSDMLVMVENRKRRDMLPLVIDAAARLMLTSLRAGFDVVLDEENLQPFLYNIFVVRAHNAGYKVQWQTMTTDAEECKRRNAERGHPVSDMAIDRKSERWSDWLKK